MSKDYMESLARLMNSLYERHMGCLIRIEGDKYIWADKSYGSLEEAKDAINAALPELEKSINRLKK
jgi:hypothetical protein